MFKSIFSALAIFAVSVSAITLPPHLPRNINENLRRAPGQVVTSCTVPNTAALTFVSPPEFLYESPTSYTCRMMAPGFTCMISARHWLQLVPSGHSSSVSVQTFSFFCDGTERLLQMVKTVCHGQPLHPYAALCSFSVLTVGDCIYTVDQAKRVKYAYDKGHQVASHTWAHKNLTTLNWDQSKSRSSFEFGPDHVTSVFS